MCVAATVSSRAQEVIVLDGLASPEGKWAPLLGNVIVIESDYAAQIVRSVADNVLTLLETFGLSTLPAGLVPTTPALGTTIPGLADARLFIDALDGETMAQYAMQVAVQVTEPWRSDTYFQDTAGIKASMTQFTDAVFEKLGPGYPATPSLPLATALAATQFIQLFLNQVGRWVVLFASIHSPFVSTTRAATRAPPP